MLYRKPLCSRAGFSTLSLALTLFLCNPAQAQDQLNLAQSPLFLGEGTAPLTMLVMGRDHKLYYEAYNDAADLNQDGVIDMGYKPWEIDYYGYFNSYQCYSYSGGVFSPTTNTADKTCSSGWSGDFLNYVTMTRMDALRKVLYGGYRSTDTASSTILERSFIPQDAHSWAKEYKSIEEDGYDIADYTPLTQPAAGTRHLFANVTRRNDNNQRPLLRVLDNSPHRAWEWVSIERPVAENQCNTPANNRVTCEKNADSGGLYTDSGAPQSNAEFTNWVDRFARPENLLYTTSVTQIDDGSAGPYPPTPPQDGQTENYLNIIKGTIFLRRGNPQTFAVDGDDAVELLIDGIPVASRYGTHGMVCNTFNVASDQSTCFGTPTIDANGLVRGASVADANGMIITTLSGDFEHQLEFRHVQRGGGAGYRMYWYNYSFNRWELFNRFLMQDLTQTVYELRDGPTPASERTDYVVRVEVCKLNPELDPGCKAYGLEGSEVYKPVGLLQEYGDEDEMFFGLLTGSFNKPTKGGILRKNISSLTDEINLNNGTFNNTVGIIETIDRLRIATFTGGNYTYANCGWITTKPLSEVEDGKCADWGNPIAEMMYETLRYFGGKESPTPAFDTTGGVDQNTLKLPRADWLNPYIQSKGDYSVCAKPNMLVIGDVNPSYDTDQLPGSAFNSSFSSDMEGMNVATDANTIWREEFGRPRRVFVGETTGMTDYAPTPKLTNSFATIRGIAPEDPSKQGGWYAASVAYHGLKTDLNEATGQQNVRTYSVAMASPLPRIEIPIREVIGGSETEDPEFGEVLNTVILVPFAKSVGGSSINRSPGNYQPTNTIVDFYIEELRDDYGRFRINYEDVEQGADHDMDMIVEYSYRITDMRNRIIDIELNSTYAAGGIIQHAGYVISGTTRDGVYLEVRDVDTGANKDPDYFLDTPNTSDPLPLRTVRTFIAQEDERPEILRNPLWYAAKWGNFNNIEPDPENPEENPIPDQQEEWDNDGDGTPDNYFLVTNALYLSEQLAAAFEEIMAQTASAAGVSASSTRLDTDVKIYQSVFNSGFWTGGLRAFGFDSDGFIKDFPDWDAADLIPVHNSRQIFVGDQGSAVPFLWDSVSDTIKNALTLTDDPLVGEDRLNFLRGDQSLEDRKGGPFRNRVEQFPGRPQRENILGDIINSAAAYVKDINYGLNALPDNLGGPEYTEWRTSLANPDSENFRPAMVYVGANDGMLHAFDAETGVERWAYIPSMVVGDLHELTDPNYIHRYFVDGSPRVSDAYFDPTGGNQPEWGTVAVGSLGAGGGGIFAIDVTDPLAFNGSQVLWEFSTADDADLGYTMSQPTIAAMQDEKFYAVFGNGYNSVNNEAVLYIVDLSTGDLAKKLTVPEISGQSGPNGLSTPAVVDVNGDRVADVIYAGDLRGNLWKFDVSDKNPRFNQVNNGWSVDGGAPLFTAVGTNGETQPITIRPEVTGHPEGGYMVFFGTGQYIALGDEVVPLEPEDREVHSFYGIRDLDGAAVSRDRLVEQSITVEDQFNPNDPEGQRYRETTENPPTAELDQGWYIDLVSPVKGRQEERVVVEPVLSGGEIIFVTLVPSEDACSFGGESWVMAMDAMTGRMPNVSTMDTNGDGLINSEDRRVSGARSTVGITSKVTVLERADGTRELIVSGTAPGEGNHLEQRSIEGTSTGGRQAWRQIQ